MDFSNTNNQSKEAILFQYWRFRTFYSIMFAFTFFYIIRNNFSFFIKDMPTLFSCTKADIGNFLFYGTIIYGVCKFLCGILSDRLSARYILSIGLLTSGITNIMLGMCTKLAPTSTLTFVMVLYCFNQVFQASGAPPCTKLLTYWFVSKERGSKWALWSSCQNIGSAIIFFLSGPIINHFGWQYLFIIPGALAIIASAIVFIQLRDTPESLGLPSVEQYRGEDVKIVNQEKVGIFKTVYLAINNRLVWLIATSNFCLYFCKNFFEKFGTLFLFESLNFSNNRLSAIMMSIEVAGIFGGIFAGMISDKFFKGNRAQVSIFYFTMIFLTLVLFAYKNTLFYYTGSAFVFVMMFMIGFFLFGSQVLTGVFSTDVSDTRAASTANAFVGIFGNLGASVGVLLCSKWSDQYGWDFVLKRLLIIAMVGVLCFVITYFSHKRKVTDEDVKSMRR